MSQRFEGRNLEEALQAAVDALGVERWKINHRVLLQKRGFLGGFKRVVIEADVNEAAVPPVAAVAPLPPLEGVPPAREHGRGPRSTGSRGPGGGRGPRRDGRGGGDNRGGRRGGPRRGGTEFRTGDFETFLGDLPEQTPESEAARSVREWCESALSLAKLDVVLRTEENETQILVRLYGSDVGRLLDRHGEALDALQVIANKALVGRKVEKDIELDCEEFKEKRVEDLERRAFNLAERVRRSGREELLPAMTPIERRIVHMALREDPEVTTESRGDGFYKRVAIILRSEAEESEPAADVQASSSES
ncbi:MAG: Jag N-terminal domain-containing protein [Acidobacteriota bacterium]|nr:Jag N-terminal domain-containing protein [Acidobacteriota bacterium]